MRTCFTSIVERLQLWSAQPPSDTAAWECQHGVEQLLVRCGPRLTDLRLVGVPRPRPPLQCREALGRCTALTSLVLQPQSLGACVTASNCVQKCGWGVGASRRSS